MFFFSLLELMSRILKQMFALMFALDHSYSKSASVLTILNLVFIYITL